METNNRSLAALSENPRPTTRFRASGGLIDEAALMDALRAGRIIGAGLDVLEDEAEPSNEGMGGTNRIAAQAPSHPAWKGAAGPVCRCRMIPSCGGSSPLWCACLGCSEGKSSGAADFVGEPGMETAGRTKSSNAHPGGTSRAGAAQAHVSQSYIVETPRG